MGRKSILTPAQWQDIEKRHLLGEESVNSLAKEYKIDEAAVRRKMNCLKSEDGKPVSPLKQLALEKIKADADLKHITEKISNLPFGKQNVVNELWRKMTAVSEHLAGAAVYGAATAHRLSGMANAQVEQIDDSKTLSSEGFEVLRGVAVLTKIANESSQIGLSLLSANKDRMVAPPDVNQGEQLTPEAAYLQMIGR